ncbi:hypothetical protein GGI02_003704 [Coemansia sp. RSA 2322]|nr:hypothetical protein GGI02_003704 [Coemansia sp. RSA 2322]
MATLEGGGSLGQTADKGTGNVQGGPPDHIAVRQTSSALQLRLTEYATMQSKSSSNSLQAQPRRGGPHFGSGQIRPLRSWSSSDKHGPRLEDGQGGGREPRRFSVAGPADGSRSTAGSRQSQKHLSLHTWAEEEDELADMAGGSLPRLAATARNAPSASRNPQAIQQPHSAKHALAAQHFRNLSHGNHQSSSRHYAHNSGSCSGGSSVSSGIGGGAFGKRLLPEAAFGFVDVASSSGSSGPLSTQHTAASIGVGGTGSHRRLRTPYSISIPSMIGSPLSFTQSFLASRSSMYGRQPPSSQIRAAHIDWDSLSMMEEAAWGANRADLPAWQQGMPLPIDFVCGAGIAAKPAGALGQPQVAFQRPIQPAGATCDAAPHHLQQIYQQQQHLQYPHASPHYQHLLQQLQQQQQRRHPHQAGLLPQQAARTSCVSGALHAHMTAAVTGSGGLPGSLGDACVGMAQLAVAEEWERQMAWDYACHHHPLLASFSVASPLKLSAAWRWMLLVVLVVSTLCVLVGTPAALTILLGRDGSVRFSATK